MSACHLIGDPNVRIRQVKAEFFHIVQALVHVKVGLDVDAGSTNTLVYSTPTWETCVARKVALVEGMRGKRNPESVTVDCRHDVHLDLGVTTKKDQNETGAGF
jgi:hypothetical protein